MKPGHLLAGRRKISAIRKLMQLALAVRGAWVTHAGHGGGSQALLLAASPLTFLG